MDELDRLVAESAPVRGQKKGISPKAAALESMPSAWREELIAAAADMGIRAEDDLAWLLVASFINAWAGAATAGKAADQVGKSVATIPDQIYQGAVRAGTDVKGVIEQKGVEIGQALTLAVGKTGESIISRLQSVLSQSIGSIQSAADGAVQKAEAARAAVIAKGTEDFAKAAQAAILSQVRATTWRNRAVGALVGAFLLFGAGVGGVIVAGLDGHITQYRIDQTASGQPNCGQANIEGIGQQYVCVMQVPKPSKGFKGFVAAWF